MKKHLAQCGNYIKKRAKEGKGESGAYWQALKIYPLVYSPPTCDSPRAASDPPAEAPPEDLGSEAQVEEAGRQCPLEVGRDAECDLSFVCEQP
jgi:hypothetical protein